MNQFFIFLNYHFLDYFEKFACTFPCYTFLTLFNICNTFVTPALHICYTLVTHLLHLCYTSITLLLHICNTRFFAFVTPRATPSLHCCNSYYYIFDAFLFCGILSGFRFVTFCPCLICGILSVIRYNTAIH